MIRMVLFAIGFIAITVTLVIVQPGAQRRVPEAPVAPSVTRADPGLTSGIKPGIEAAESSNAVDLIGGGLAMPEQSARVAPATPRVSRPIPAPTGGNLDDQEMRRMTWETLSSLNQATGRESAPGQPGSLLHTIVRRSLDGAPVGGLSAQPNLPEIYVVVEGDSLVSIAEKVYGDVNMTGPLFAANQALLSRPDDLRPGQTLVLPRR